MKKHILLTSILLIIFSLEGKSQFLETINTINNWNQIQKPGFYEILGKEGSNSPQIDGNWWWGLSTASIGNTTNKSYSTAQIAIGNASYPVKMYVRATTPSGTSPWTKILHDQGLQTIRGGLTIQDDLILQTGDSYVTPLGQYGKKIYFGYKTADNGDHIYMSRYNRGENSSDLRVNIGDDNGGGDRFVVGNARWNAPEVWRDWFVVTDMGVGINGVSDPTCALEVNGVIRAKEVKIEAANWPDYVFHKEYNLPALSEVENHINEHKHLPNIPSEAEVKENGVDIGDLQIKLLQKIEELTLYTIQQQKQLEEQGLMIRELQSTINNNLK